MTLAPIILTGVGIPAFSAWVGGDFPTSVKELIGNRGRKIAIGSLAGIAVAGLGFMAAQAAAAPTLPPQVIPPQKYSVSNVTTKLGRHAGGIDYPGQITGSAGASATYTNGDLVYVD